MAETSRGVSRVVVLALFTVLFVAAWRSDHVETNRSDTRQARSATSRRTVSTVVASAASIGQLLPSCAAARLAPADQTNGLTLHTDRGVSAALERAVPVRVTDDSTPVVDISLGTQLVVIRNRAVEQPIRFLGSTALLSGSWLESTALSSPAAVHVPSAAPDGPGAIDEADVEGLDVTARALR
jgi:hypothetical protein